MRGAPRAGRHYAVTTMDAAPDTRLRVMLVDDHEIVRSGIKAMLAATDDIRVVAEAESVEHAPGCGGHGYPSGRR
jgi:hypothetical protein